MNLKGAIAAVNRRAVLLVFPIDNAKEDRSLWHEFYPRSKMRWEWDENGDNRVPELWFLRERLSSSGKVIYAKWFKGRATVISRSLFVPLFAALNAKPKPLSRTAREVLNILEDNSPLSTKVIKKAVDLRGKDNEAAYTRALKELWERLLIVGFGEVDDGAFPSLAIGASKLLFEDLHREARELSLEAARDSVRAQLSNSGDFLQFYEKLTKIGVGGI